MNHTKWNELFRAFYAEELKPNGRTIPWRILSVGGFCSPWDDTWTHFGCEPTAYKSIDRLEIRLTDENRGFVLNQLRRIHVPGEINGEIVTVFGYSQTAEYL